jgi:hypothetical protein
VGANRDPRPHLGGDLGDRGVFGRVVLGERVDRNDRRDAVQADVLDLLAQVRPSSAASSISLGTSSMNERISQIASGRFIAV